MRIHRQIVPLLLCLAASCGGEKPAQGNATTASSAPAASVADALPPITPVKAVEALTPAEVSAAFGGAVFKVTEERNDPPAGYSSISGCHYVEEGPEEMSKRHLMVTIRSHGVEKDAAGFLKSRLEMARETGVPVTLAPELGEHAFLSHRSAASGGTRIEYRRGKDYFELAYVVLARTTPEETTPLLTGLARASLAP